VLLRLASIGLGAIAICVSWALLSFGSYIAYLEASRTPSGAVDEGAGLAGGVILYLALAVVCASVSAVATRAMRLSRLDVLLMPVVAGVLLWALWVPRSGVVATVDSVLSVALSLLAVLACALLSGLLGVRLARTPRAEL
jgi:hypothetical protein